MPNGVCFLSKRRLRINLRKVARRRNGCVATTKYNMFNFIKAFIKFYYHYMLFGILAIIILYASADVRCFIETGESFFWTLRNDSQNITEIEAFIAVSRFFKIAIASIPSGEAFVEALLGITFDSNMETDVISLFADLIKSGEALSTLGEAIRIYPLFSKDMAVATLASMVLYATAHAKERFERRGLSARLGIWLSSIFWILAAYTFADTVTYALEKRVSPENYNSLYIIIIVFAVILEMVIHAYGGRCSIIRLSALLCFKLLLNIPKAVLVWYVCYLFVYSFTVGGLSNISAMLIFAGLVVCLFGLEGKVTKWAHKALFV